MYLKGSGNLFCKVADGKYTGLCEPHKVSVTCSSLLLIYNILKNTKSTQFSCLQKQAGEGWEEGGNGEGRLLGKSFCLDDENVLMCDDVCPDL